VNEIVPSYFRYPPHCLHIYYIMSCYKIKFSAEANEVLGCWGELFYPTVSSSLRPRCLSVSTVFTPLVVSMVPRTMIMKENALSVVHSYLKMLLFP